MKNFLIGLALASAGTAFAAQGLSGTYYNPGPDTTGIWDGFTGAANYLANNPTAAGSFTATVFDYHGSDGSAIQGFLGTDATSYVGANGNLADGVIVLKGWIDLGAGTTSLGVAHDDGFRMFLDGTNIAQAGCCGTDSVDVNFATAGWHSFEVDYNNGMYGGYSGGATFTVLENGQVISASNLSTTAVPEPQNLALLLAGLALVGTVARRRQAK